MIKRLYTESDQLNNTATFELDGGLRITLDGNAVREHGAFEMLRAYGYGDQLPTVRVPVIHKGKRIGTLPPDFDPRNIKSNSVFYDGRPGDFTLVDGAWIVGRALGADDVDCVVGFSWEKER